MRLLAAGWVGQGWVVKGWAWGWAWGLEVVMAEGRVLVAVGVVGAWSRTCSICRLSQPLRPPRYSQCTAQATKVHCCRQIGRAHV